MKDCPLIGAYNFLNKLLTWQEPLSSEPNDDKQSTYIITVKTIKIITIYYIIKVMDVLICFENDDRFYSIPYTVMELYPSSPLLTYSQDGSVVAEQIRLTLHIKYKDFECGYQYIMNYRRYEVTKPVKILLVHYGFWDDQLEIHEMRQKAEKKFLRRTLAGRERIIVLNDEIIYDNICNFAQQYYPHVIPLICKVVSNTITSVALEKMWVPICPMSSEFYETRSFVKASNEIKERQAKSELLLPDSEFEKMVMIRFLETHIVGDWKGEEINPGVPKAALAIFRDLSDLKELTQSAFEQSGIKRFREDLLYAFYLAPA